jgi:hypothetical protein
MKIQAYFENISAQIISELIKSKMNIRIAVAWFTDKEIFDLLCTKVREINSIQLILIDDKINRGSRIDYDLLTEAGGKIHWISKDQDDKAIMHNKFCIIDEKTIITGSYNWSKQAKKNYENITVINDDPKLMIQYLNEFNHIKSHLSGDEIKPIKINTDMILKRVEALKVVITLEDVEDIIIQSAKLSELISKYDFRTWDVLNDLQKILKMIDNMNYKEAVIEIEKVLKKQRQVIIYEDPTIPAIKLEIRGLEYQISSLQAELTSIEKLIYQYEIMHNKELGELLTKILKLKRDKLKQESNKDKSKKDAYNEAEKDYKDYKNTNLALDKKEIFTLDENQKIDIKELYKEGVFKCHPDRVADELKQKAESTFINLNEAYKANDFKKVKEIVDKIRNDRLFVSKSESIDKKKLLIVHVAELEQTSFDLLEKIRFLKESETYITISSIDDWDKHFSDLKSQLNAQLSLYSNKTSR